MPYLDTLAQRVGERARTEVALPLPGRHRALQQRAEACAYAYVTSANAGVEPDPALLDQARACLDALAAQQGSDGLFLTGDNVQSPPDSSFTANGLARLVRVCRGRSEVAAVGEQALGILRTLTPGLLTGGVHTPNHRWELAAALAQLADLLDDRECGERVDEWLAEGVDQQPDGLYSERSPNYAAHVTNPCLLALADLRGRPDLVDAVHDNLHAHLWLTDRTGRVETLQSRRQDQKVARFDMAAFAWQYRVLAHRARCGQCGAAAAQGEERGGSDVLDAVAGVLLDPDLAVDPPVRPGPERTGWTVLETSELAIHRNNGCRLVVRAAPDVNALGRVASGVANNPTLAHLRSGAVWLSSVRLSRTFFGLGPFRGQRLRLDGGRAVLSETLAAGYYQPLPPQQLRHTFEGRFAAEMSFDDRREDLVSLDTRVTVAPADTGLDLVVTTEGPRVRQSLELGFDGDGEVSGEVVRLADGCWLVLGEAVVALAGGSVRVTASGQITEDDPEAPFYDPGEAYTFLDGTDAVSGLRLYLGAWAPGELRVGIRILALDK